jgi:thiamine transporter ThiT
MVLGWGILLLIAGKPWLLIVSLLAYLVAFAKIGCLSH